MTTGGWRQRRTSAIVVASVVGYPRRDDDDDDMMIDPKINVRHSLQRRVQFANATDDVDVDARGPGSISRRDDDDAPDGDIGDVERRVSGDDDAPDER